MEQPKKISEWLKTIKDPNIAAKAFNNFWNQESHDSEVYSLKSAIDQAMTWANTLEGQKFWENSENYM